MEKVKEMLEGLNYAELLEVSNMLPDYKKAARENAKEEADSVANATVDRVNALIASGKLKIGTEIFVSYKGNTVQALVETVPTEKAKNLRLYSAAFDGGTQERYSDKAKFVDLID